MSTKGGPNIIKDSLVLNLDSSNKKSFKGEPTENLINNPKAEQGIPGFSDPSSPSSAYLSLSTNFSLFGNTSVKFESSVAVSYANVYFHSNDLSGMVAGGTYTFSMYIYVPTSVNLTSFRFIWYDYGPDGNTGSSTYHYSEDIPRDQWHRISATKTLNPNSTRSFIYIYRYKNSSPEFLGESVYYDSFQLEPGSTPTTFADDSNNLVVNPTCDFLPQLQSRGIGLGVSSVELSNEQAHSGTNSLKVTSEGLTYSQYRFNSNNLSGMQPGKSYTFSFWVYLPSVNTTFSRFRCRWYDYGPDGNTNSSQYTALDAADIPRDTWHRLFFTKTLNPNSTRSFIYLYQYHSSDITAHRQSIYLDGFQLENKLFPSKFTKDFRGTTVSEGGGWEDLSKNNNHGEITESLTWEENNLGTLVFNGVDSFSVVSSLSGDVPRQQGTAIFWLKIQNYTSDKIFVLAQINDGSSGFGNGLSFSLYNNNRFLGIVNAGSERIFAYTSPLDLNYLNDGNFKQLVYSWDGSFQDWYINGESIGTGSSSFIPNITPNTYEGYPLFIGKRNSERFFEGEMTKILLYNKALTPEEIKQNYNATKARFGL